MFREDEVIELLHFMCGLEVKRFVFKNR